MKNGMRIESFKSQAIRVIRVLFLINLHPPPLPLAYPIFDYRFSCL